MLHNLAAAGGVAEPIEVVLKQPRHRHAHRRIEQLAGDRADGAMALRSPRRRARRPCAEGQQKDGERAGTHDDAVFTRRAVRFNRRACRLPHPLARAPA